MLKRERQSIKVALGLACLATCAVVSARAADTKPPGALRWMGHWKGEGARERMVREALEEFRFLHPELRVEFAFAADVLPEKAQGAAGARIAEMLKSGDLRWDVVWMDPLVYQKVAEELDDWNWGREHLVDFAAVPGFARSQKRFLVAGAAAHAFTGGQFTGPYIEGFFHTVWYNKEVARRVGIEVRERGMTEADLLAYAAAVRRHNQATGESIATFLDVAHSASMARLYYNLLYSHFADDEIEVAGPAAVARAQDRVDQVFAALAATQPLRENGGPKQWAESARHMLKENRALFFFDATWRYTAFESACPNELGRLGMARMPGFGGHCHKVGGYMPTWAVLKNAPGRDAGIELMRYWSRPPIAQKWARLTKCPTGIKGDLVDFTFGSDMFARYQRELRAECDHLLLDPLVFCGGPTTNTALYGHVDPARVAAAVRLVRGEGGPE